MARRKLEAGLDFLYDVGGSNAKLLVLFFLAFFLLDSMTLDIIIYG